jgi:hypothetical protein
VVLHPGLPMFIAAICLNMIASETMCHLEVKPKKSVLEAADGGSVYVRPNDRSGWRKVVVPILLLLNAILLVYVIQAPIMQLTAFFMIPETYCIWTFG